MSFNRCKKNDSELSPVILPILFHFYVSTHYIQYSNTVCNRRRTIGTVRMCCSRRMFVFVLPRFYRFRRKRYVHGYVICIIKLQRKGLNFASLERTFEYLINTLLCFKFRVRRTQKSSVKRLRFRNHT